MTDCPCCSGKEYGVCCQPILMGEKSTTALSLMRSRYTAYSMAQAKYLYETTHSSTKSKYNIDELEKWAKENTWTKLEIIGIAHGGVNDERGVVEFNAHIKDQKDKTQVHHERSAFLKEKNQWFYVEGKMNPKEVGLINKVLRNDPCPCGSGKKFKKCCA